MADNYYYLIAGLPDLIAGEMKKGLTFETVLEEVVDELTPEDKEYVNWLRYRYDNENLINLLEEKDTFDNRGVFSQEELSEDVQSPEKLPLYMQSYLDAKKEGKNLFPELDERETLAMLYYTELLKSTSPFLKEWGSFELTMNNFVAAKGARALGIDLEKSVLPIGESAEHILKSSANDFGLAGIYDWIESIMNAYGEPLRLEETIDDIRWRIAEECSAGHYFSIEVVLAFMIKLHSVARWQQLDTERGAARLKGLLADLKSAVNVKN